MEFFNVFLTVAIFIMAGMIGFTAWSVLRTTGSVPTPAKKGASRGRSAADWRVYAVDEGGNCFCGAEIILPTERDEFIIGRQKGCQLRIMRPEIGRRHAKIGRKGIVYTLYDLGSYAGCVCNHARIKEIRLEHMMVVWINDVALVFVNCEVNPEFITRAVKNSSR